MGKIAFVFAGQGAQSVGMGKELYDNFESARRIFELAGGRIKSLCFDGPQEDLNLTVNTQPCLFAMDLAAAYVLNENGIFADAVAGFSLGEIPALAYAKMLSDQAAFDLVCFRGERMHACAQENKGVMFAVLKLSVEQIEELCQKVGAAFPVNYNCPGQTVVACGEESAESFQKEVASVGGKTIQLAVSGAFHSPFMEKASQELGAYLGDIELQEMEIPVYSNVTAKIYENPKELIAKQVKSPVLWQKTIENMISDGIDTFIEVGAGKTLSGLIKKIDSTVNIMNVCDLASLEEVRHAKG